MPMQEFKRALLNETRQTQNKIRDKAQTKITMAYNQRTPKQDSTRISCFEIPTSCTYCF